MKNSPRPRRSRAVNKRAPKMGQMIARRRHDEMEVAIDLLAVALGHDRLERRGGLLEGGARLSGAPPSSRRRRPRPRERIAIGIQIVAELRRKGRCVRWKCTIAPDDRARLAACNKAPPKPAVAASAMSAAMLQASLASAITRS